MFIQNDIFLAYIQRFDIIPQLNPLISGSTTQRGQYPDPSSGMYVVKKATRSNGTPIGDIVPLNQLQSLVDLTPRFGAKADTRFDKTNSLACATEFWLNKYFDKDLFFALDNV